MSNLKSLVSIQILKKKGAQYFSGLPQYMNYTKQVSLKAAKSHIDNILQPKRLP